MGSNTTPWGKTKKMVKHKCQKKRVNKTSKKQQEKQQTTQKKLTVTKTGEQKIKKNENIKHTTKKN